MLVSLENIHFLIPEIILLSTGILCLLVELFVQKEALTFTIASIGLLSATICSAVYMDDFSHVILHGLFISDNLSQLMKIFIYVIVFLSLFYSRSYIKERQMPSGEYYVLGLFSALGMLLLVSAHSLLMIYLGLELVSLPIYAMTAIRRMSGNGSEAALKYFVMGALASAFLLFGMSFVYGVTGQLDLQQVSHVIGEMPKGSSLMLSFALVFIVAAIAFKMATVPFHMWAPDVYEGAPTSVTPFSAVK
jgi:NADH-quinone oxidoreductase subunit N